MAMALSADGRFVSFTSFASDVVPGDTNGREDIFVLDRQSHHVERVSVSTAGVQGNSSSFQPSISADGRYVLFVSEATNLVPGGNSNNITEVFVRDRNDGTNGARQCGFQRPGGQRFLRFRRDQS